MNIRLYAVRISQPLSEAELSALARFLPPERQDRAKTPEALCAYALLCHNYFGNPARSLKLVAAWRTYRSFPTASTASRTLLRIRTFISV